MIQIGESVKLKTFEGNLSQKLGSGRRKKFLGFHGQSFWKVNYADVIPIMGRKLLIIPICKVSINNKNLYKVSRFNYFETFGIENHISLVFLTSSERKFKQN